MDYKPDVNDYLIYKHYCNSFFHSSRGRAAILAGGLIARLARDYVDMSEIYYGPSNDVTTDGKCYYHEHTMGYWDDCLTEHEVDLICGVYRVDTGMCFYWKCFVTNVVT